MINELEADLKKTRAGLHLSSQNLAECEHERDELMEKLNGHGGALDQLRDARYAYTMKKNENAELRQDLRNAEIKLKEENAALKKRIIELDQATCDHSWDFTGVCEFCGAFGSIDYE